MRLAVVGGGIAGLAAAHEASLASGVEVVLLESSDRLGGKISTGKVAGCTVELGPDAFLARRPEAVALCEELGLAGRLVPPSTGEAAVWSRGRLRPLPPGLLLGVPTRPAALVRSGVLSLPGSLRTVVEPLIPGSRTPTGDTSIGSVSRRRLGDEAHERLVDPLLGGINAGDTDRLSLDACAPQVAAAARASRSLVRGARSVISRGRAAGPVFLTHEDGLGAVVSALEESLRSRGVEIRTGHPVDTLEPAPGGVRADGPRGAHEFDAVVLAVPAFVAAGMLTTAPPAAEVLAAVEHASVALAVIAYRRAEVPQLRGSGFLVPRVEGRTITACSFASTKWSHVGDHDTVLVRASVGRAGDERALDLDDEPLVDAVRADLGALAGIHGDPLDVRLVRWPLSFPQYAPGHLDRVAGMREALRRDLPHVELAGAALGGVGIPACIGSGRAAARAVLGEHAAAPGRGRP